MAFVSVLHRAVADYLRPAGATSTTDGHDFTARFTVLLALASLFIPFFLFEFVVTGNTPAAVALSIAACGMATSACAYKWTGSQALARDLFLGGLFVFLLWEASYFDTIYSPGTVWLGVMSVVSILLGSLRAAVGWLAIGIAAIVGTFLLTGTEDSSTLISSPSYQLLFTVSVCGVFFAIFLFVVMVDSGRAEAHARLVSANDEIRVLAERDELTGLFNRRALRNLLHTAMSDEHREAAAIFADLDGFKDVNDSYGHHVGDRLIQKMAAGLKDISERNGAIAARLGGDEFAIVIPGSNAAERAETIGRQILQLVTQPIDVDGRRATVGVSLGLAFAGEDVTPAELMRRADVALYAAKSDGRMRICRYCRELDTSRLRRRSIAAMLERSLASAQIEVHYQPIVCSKSRAVTGVEALARWTPETGEAVSPEEFIPIAEEAGLIDRLGLFVLERACRDAADWPGIRVAVNLSPVQFRSPTLVEDILDVLKRNCMEPRRLELEVTEGYLIEHKEKAQPVIAALRKRGIRIALDDFGSGYASIGYLRQYAFDRLKIDRSLVKNVVADDASRSIIQAVSILARSLSLSVTAEGVEDEDTARLLRLAGCESLQGYYFGLPMPRGDIARLIERQPPLVSSATERLGKTGTEGA